MAPRSPSPRKANPQAVPGATQESPLIGNARLRQIYAAMLKCRLLDQRLCALSAQGKLSAAYTSSLGQEAAAVATAIDLRPGDAISPPPGDVLSAFLKGLTLETIFRQLAAGSRKKGTAGRAPSDSEAPNLLPPSSSMGAQLGIAVGVALAYARMKTGNLAVAYCSDDESGHDSWHEAPRFAGRHDLPILFVFHRELRTAHDLPNPDSPSRDSGVELPSFGFPAITVDGHDAVAVYRVAQEAMARARRGQGPTLIECKNYASLASRTIHAKPDDMQRKRRGAQAPRMTEPVSAKAADPIAAMEFYLSKKALFTPEWKAEIRDSFQRELDTAVRAARRA